MWPFIGLFYNALDDGMNPQHIAFALAVWSNRSSASCASQKWVLGKDPQCGLWGGQCRESSFLKSIPNSGTNFQRAEACSWTRLRGHRPSVYSYPTHQRSLSLSICWDSMYLLQLPNEGQGGGQSTQASEKKLTSTKVDGFDSTGLGSSYTWSYLADYSKECGAGGWG